MLDGVEWITCKYDKCIFVEGVSSVLSIFCSGKNRRLRKTCRGKVFHYREKGEREKDIMAVQHKSTRFMLKTKVSNTSTTF